MIDDQTNLFDARPAIDRPNTTTGNAWPETSHQAADRALPKSGTQRRKVYDLIAGASRADRSGWEGQGLSDDQIRIALAIPFGSELARRNELVRDGWVVDSGNRGVTESGRATILWKAVPE